MRLSFVLMAALFAARLSALTIDEISLGEYVRGPKLSTQEMRGQVVLVDLWGVECPNCIAQMPGFEQIYERYRHEGFHIVALEKQRHSLDVINNFFTVNSFIREANIQYQITYGDGTAPTTPYIPGRYAPFLPANYLFSSDGNLVAMDLHDDELEIKVRELIEETWSKQIVLAKEEVASPALKEILASLRSGRNIMPALKDLAVKRRESTGAEDQLAIAKIFNAVFTAAYKRLERSIAEKDSKPIAALYRLDGLARDLKGCAIAEKAAKAAEELRKDQRVIDELRAEAQLREVITHISDLRRGPHGEHDPADPTFRQTNRVALDQMAGECRRLMAMYANTDAARHVRTVVDDFQLRVGE